MGGEADRSDYDHRLTSDGDGDGDGGRVLEWEIGLPSADDLTPLSQPLVPPELASAFSITPEPAKTILDVHRASQSTISSLRKQSSSSSASALKSFSPFPADDQIVEESDDPKDEARIPTDDQSARTLKRPRLVWTPQLHKRFVDVVAHLGIKNTVPKTIMQLMNVEGLTRENVASHLQKYRLYLKRMQGLSNEGPSASDPLFASTPVPQSLHENPPPMPAQQPPPPPHQPMPMPMPYAMIPMPMFGMPHHNGGMGMMPVNNGHHGHYQHQQHFGGFGEQRTKDWASGSKFGTSVASYPPRITPNDK